MPEGANSRGEGASQVVYGFAVLNLLTTLSYARAGDKRWAVEKDKGWWAHLDSNQGPTGYEPVALTN